MERKASFTRTTNETNIVAAICLSGSGNADINTGIGFFDHILTIFAKHSMFDVKIHATGDLWVDAHHTVEDTGIVLGEVFKQALRDKNGIERYGTAIIPMDEALVMVSLDISGRSMLNFDCQFPPVMLGSFAAELVEEFFKAFTRHAGITLHIRKLAGSNTHHTIEATFKALARALRDAVAVREGTAGIPSTKGVL